MTKREDKMKAKIIQPNTKYMIQEVHYSKEQAEEYLEMLITKGRDILNRKRAGEDIARNITIEHLEEVITNLEIFKIIEINN